jgi:hypothetical protein
MGELVVVQSRSAPCLLRPIGPRTHTTVQISSSVSETLRGRLCCREVRIRWAIEGSKSIPCAAAALSHDIRHSIARCPVTSDQCTACLFDQHAQSLFVNPEPRRRVMQHARRMVVLLNISIATPAFDLAMRKFPMPTKQYVSIVVRSVARRVFFESGEAKFSVTAFSDGSWMFVRFCFCHALPSPSPQESPLRFILVSSVCPCSCLVHDIPTVVVVGVVAPVRHRCRYGRA